MAQSSRGRTHRGVPLSIEDEALKVARSTQGPGQTKEHTRLIAKGIEKGVELYKQQQRIKARERDKSRKKLLRQRTEPVVPVSVGTKSQTGQDIGWLVRDTLLVLVVSFGLSALGILSCIIFRWNMVVGSINIAWFWLLLPLSLFGFGSFWLCGLMRKLS